MQAEEELDLWTRLIAKREKDAAALKPSALEDILATVSSLHPTPDADVDDCANSLEQLKYLLGHHLKVCSDESMQASKRRASWNALSRLLSLIDDNRPAKTKAVPSSADEGLALADRADKTKPTASIEPVAPSDNAADRGAPVQQQRPVQLPSQPRPSMSTDNDAAENGHSNCRHPSSDHQQDESDHRSHSSTGTNLLPVQPGGASNPRQNAHQQRSDSAADIGLSVDATALAGPGKTSQGQERAVAGSEHSLPSHAPLLGQLLDLDRAESNGVDAVQNRSFLEVIRPPTIPPTLRCRLCQKVMEESQSSIANHCREQTHQAKLKAAQLLSSPGTRGKANRPIPSYRFDIQPSHLPVRNHIQLQAAQAPSIFAIHPPTIPKLKHLRQTTISRSDTTRTPTKNGQSRAQSENNARGAHPSNHSTEASSSASKNQSISQRSTSEGVSRSNQTHASSQNNSTLQRKDGQSVAATETRPHPAQKNGIGSHQSVAQGATNESSTSESCTGDRSSSTTNGTSLQTNGPTVAATVSRAAPTQNGNGCQLVNGSAATTNLSMNKTAASSGTVASTASGVIGANASSPSRPDGSPKRPSRWDNCPTNGAVTTGAPTTIPNPMSHRPTSSGMNVAATLNAVLAANARGSAVDPRPRQAVAGSLNGKGAEKPSASATATVNTSTASNVVPTHVVPTRDGNNTAAPSIIVLPKPPAAPSIIALPKPPAATAPSVHPLPTAPAGARVNNPPSIPNGQRATLSFSDEAQSTAATDPPKAPMNMTIRVSADTKPTTGCTFARTVLPRPLTSVTFRESAVDRDVVRRSAARIREWDPFWVCKLDMQVGTTFPVHHTHPKTDLIKTAARGTLDFGAWAKFPMQWGPKRSNATWANGNFGLLLRMIPLNRDEHTTKRADCHLWPKGTFLEINHKRIELTQRKQQSHNRKEWSYVCKGLDVGALISVPQGTNSFQMSCFDDQAYFYSFSYCQYRSVDSLMQSLVSESSAEKLESVSWTQGMARAINLAQGMMAQGVDSDDDDDDQDELGKFVFSLKCPISQMIMTTPVRGKTCKHWQCYDLKNYLSVNELTSGSRWRCGSCESFVSVENLEVCGLTQQILQDFKETVSNERDRVEFCSDGTYTLLEERKGRNKRPAPDDDTNVRAAAAAAAAQPVPDKKPKVYEIIELSD